MKFKIIFFLFTVTSLLCIDPTLAQTQINPASVDVNKLTDAQIDRIIQEIQARGLSQEEAITLARSQGATQTQIDQLMLRIQQRQGAVGINTGVVPTQSVSPALPTSELTRDINTQKVIFNATEKNKKIYGFKLFNTDNLSFEPPVNIPIPKNYALGIGDQVNISVWGASQTNYSLIIDNNGAVTIPDVGPVYLTGISFEKAQILIKNKLTAIYSGMVGDYPNTWAEISLGAIRSIKVNVIGEINAPGTYTLPATASAFNALYLSGGPNEFGSFREIRLIRDGVTIKTIDVYDFLINADPTADIQLRDQDILFVPTFKIRVEMNGEVKRNGYFELKSNENLSDLIRFAGGFTEKAYTNFLSLSRNTDREKEVQDIAYADIGKIQLQNGDILQVNPILERFTNRISISGAVFHPGDYELTPEMKLSDLIRKADGVKEDAFLNRGQITRLKDDYTLENISFNLKNVLSGNEDITLKKEDKISILSLFELREEWTINIVGEVQNPQQIPFRENMTLGDLIYLSGGFKEDADVSSIEISRRLSYDDAAKVTNELNKIYQFSVPRSLNLTPEEASFKLQPFDEVFVRRAPGFRDQGTVIITGEVKYAGTYSISNKNERITDLVKRAGGLIPGSYTKGATLTRRNNNSSQTEILKKKELLQSDSSLSAGMLTSETFIVGIDLDKILANPLSGIDLLLQPGDVINIPNELQTVKVSGAVLNPLALTYQKSLNFKEYISLAGGYNTKAKKSKAYVIYPNGSAATIKGSILQRKPKITPGSEIIVPMKPERTGTDNTMKWISIASVLSSLAVSIATIVNLTQ
jgi:protein involved in polysaccharide export with SLBB domain